VRTGLSVDDLGGLLDDPRVAILATIRPDGSVLLSPVWHEWRDGGFNVVTDSRGVKAVHLRRDPRAGIVVCEHSPPYRGLELRCSAQLSTSTARVDDAVKRIASRYLGREAGATYAEKAADDLLIRLEPGDLRAWDFTDERS
jgi:PPOX class probable F420-dependent enzyme